MSVYSQLLRSALDQSHAGQGSTTGDVLAQLLERRSQLGSSLSLYTGSDWAPGAIADQLAYDVALIELSRRLGIEVDLAQFGQPQRERARLEQVLKSRGIHLDGLNESTQRNEAPLRAWGQR